MLAGVNWPGFQAQGHRLLNPSTSAREGPMARQNTDLRWEPRVPGLRIRRLYETDARGIRDEVLLDEVAYALYSRCESILTVTEAVRGRVKCPRCGTLCRRLRAARRESREDPLRG